MLLLLDGEVTIESIVVSRTEPITVTVLGASGSGSAVAHGAPSERVSPAIVRWCSEALNSSSARSTLTSAVVGTARTWRGSGTLARSRARGLGGGSGGASSASS